MIKHIQTVLDVILFISMTFMILISPYTKVEESFNVQALHDIINIGVDQIEMFDHMTFSGPVKRTCLGILFLSLPSVGLPVTMKRFSGYLVSLAVILHSLLPTPTGALNIDAISIIFSYTKIPQLLITRFLLGVVTFFSLIYLRRSTMYACSKKSKLIGLWFSLFLYPLPHVLYYSSRFLPNFICFPITNIAIALFISGDITRSISVLILTGIIFRFEVLVFAGILVLICVTGLFRNGFPLLSIREAIVSIFTSTMLSLILCYGVDSYFWNVEFTIPEFESFLFNVIGGNSSQWGTESPYAYFNKYFPKLFATGFDIALILSIIFFITSLMHLNSLNNKTRNNSYDVDYVNYGVGTITTLMWCSFLFMIVMSFNGHKEWRFLVYIIPILCVGAASTTEWIMSKRSFLKKILTCLIIICYFTSLISSFIFGFISSWNYTGGDAAQKLNLKLLDMYGDGSGMLRPIVVHWDVGTCMNGGSLFTQIADNKIARDFWLENDDEEYERETSYAKFWIVYDKTEDEITLNDIVDNFDYWIQYDEEEIVSLSDGYEWILIDVVEGYAGIDVEYLLNVAKNPMEIIFQLLHSIETMDLQWFKNVLDGIIKKKVRGRIWEKSFSSKDEKNSVF